jgi:hypothetical protein
MFRGSHPPELATSGCAPGEMTRTLSRSRRIARIEGDAVLWWISSAQPAYARITSLHVPQGLGRTPLPIVASTAPQSLGFPWAWLAVGAAAAVGVLAFATGMSASGSDAEWRRRVASAYGDTSALVDAAGAMLSRLEAGSAESWSKLAHRGNDALAQLHAAEVEAPQPRQRERLADLIGLISVLVVDIEALAEAPQRNTDAAARLVQRRLNEVDGALERLRGTL